MRVGPCLDYDQVASDYARYRDAQPFVVETLRHLQALSPGGATLEVGCGAGAYICALARYGPGTRFGMDASRRMLEQAPQRARIAFVQGHATRLPFADRSLDMIFSVNVVHHIENVAAYFGESFRVLRPDGISCTATDSEAIIARREPLSRYWPATVPIELSRYHAIEKLRDAMTAAGFGGIEQWHRHARFAVSDSAPYRHRAFSCLRLIAEDEFARGLRDMEADLSAGPVPGNSELVFLWGRHP
ncbi:MAG: methyltransferase domain-containing protein [Gammaproteobacteria bacterium]|nr:methyltransferase domain-containing protein [Gammaproteobacteria bacterium]NIN39467.1 methyltransferase domain-containing protein [Gammaproteobacteria bacterium]NIP46629.1 class I SAM-dependent methyltransferase [Gammaproteobacteria bacterium]NIP66408.1 methyltransferase domain-containing protein [Gammaproteobacteria bacterium]NIQ28646.1 methyltransferase domain-containing protein [Gammaproteobacteria bacterium]